jgi:hypothetical protein
MDTRQAVADGVGDLAGPLLNCGAFLLARLLLAPGCLRVALSVGRFLTRNPRQMAVAQDVVDVRPRTWRLWWIRSTTTLNTIRSAMNARSSRGSSSRSRMRTLAECRTCVHTHVATWLRSFLDLDAPTTEPGSARVQRVVVILNLVYGMAAIVMLVLLLIAVGRTS